MLGVRGVFAVAERSEQRGGVRSKVSMEESQYWRLRSVVSKGFDVGFVVRD